MPVKVVFKIPRPGPRSGPGYEQGRALRGRPEFPGAQPPGYLMNYEPLGAHNELFRR
jgi:hypothetical protein